MEILSKYISDEFLYSIGWTIFHSVWIGALISLLLIITLVLLGNSSAKTRYNIAMASLLLLALVVSAVFIHTLDTQKSEAVNLSYVSDFIPGLGSAALADAGNINTQLTDQGAGKKIIVFLNSNYSLISLLWLIGIVLMTVRFTGGLVFSGMLGKNNRGAVISTYSGLVNRLQGKLGIKRKIKIVESFIARVPMTSGWLKPVIYVPLGALAGLPYNQVEAIIAHELAHIKRNDYLLNLVQSVIEIILFYHPAVWWISSLIRSERESACDDIAVELSDEKLTYIKALVSISEFETGTTGAAVAFAGDNSNLLNRIKRIAKMKKGKMNRTDKLTSAFMSIIIIAGVMIMMSFRSDPGVDESPSSPASIIETAGTPEYTAIQQVLTVKQDPEKVTGKITQEITDPVDGKEKDAVFTFKESKLTSLSVDGRKIPESDYPVYKKLIDEARNNMVDIREDMEDALVDIEEAMEDIEDIDMGEIELDMQEALSEIDELDIEKMEFEIQEALEEFKNLKIENFQFDLQETLSEIEESLKEIGEIDMKEVEHEMQKAIEEVKKIDVEKMRKEIMESMESLEEIDTEKIMKEMEESMKEIQESLNDLNIDMRNKYEIHMKHNDESRKKELEKKLIELQEDDTSKKGKK